MSREIWDRNLKAMEKWYPAFADMIREEKYTKDDLEIIPEISWDGEMIFRIKKEDRVLYLEGKRNTREPVQMWLERLGEVHKYAPVFLFGTGNGSYLKALIHNTQKEVNVVVYEPSVTIFLTMLEKIDLSEEIEDRPIAFIIEGLNENEYKPVMHKVLVYENLEFLKEEIHPNYKEFFADKLIEKVKILQKQVESMFVQINTGTKMSSELAKNILCNMKYICEGYNTKKLSEVVPYQGAAILVSAGPSLNKNIHELKKAKNKAFILAVDTAIKPLIRAGIVPDAFVTIDAKKPLHLVDIEGAENIPVIAPTSAANAILEHQKAKKIFYFDGYMIPFHIYLMNGKIFPDVSSGGSVACSGLSLLYKMGFDTIILMGQDLAYTGNKSHADGTFQETMPEENTKNMIMVKANDGGKLPTRTDFKIYLDWFGMYIKGMKEHRNVRVINATEGGAYIEGTEISALKDIIAEVCHEEIDFSACIDKIQPEFSLEERKKAVEYLHKIPEEFEVIRKNAVALKKVYRKLEKISKSGNIDKNGCLKQLKKIKKLSKQVKSKDSYQLIETSMPVAEYIIRSEYFYEEKSLEAETKEIARKGILYSDLLEKCAELLKDAAEETLLPIEV